MVLLSIPLKASQVILGGGNGKVGVSSFPADPRQELRKAWRRKLGKEGYQPGHGTEILPDLSSHSRAQGLFSSVLVNRYFFSSKMGCMLLRLPLV